VVTDLAFANHELCRVFAHVFDWNPASARVLEKAGYAFEGRMRKSVTKEGQSIDQLMYAKIREETLL
jgi:RimJ/RimL family protein N-acetyltransferase